MVDARRIVTLTLQDGTEVELTEQQAKFAQQTAIQGNAAASYRNNYDYSGKPNNARQRAWKLINDNEHIQKAIEYYSQEVKQKLDVSFERVIAEYAAMGFSNITDIVDTNGGIKSLNDIDPAAQKAIKSIKVKNVFNPETKSNDEIIEIQMHDKKGSLDKVAQLCGHMDDEEKQSNAPVNVTFNINGDNVSVESQE